MKSTGYVFKSRDYIGSAQPPATVLEDESRFGRDGTFKADGEPDWVQLPSGLWVMSFASGDTVGLSLPFMPKVGAIEGWWYWDSQAAWSYFTDSFYKHLNGAIYVDGTVRYFLDAFPLIGAWNHVLITWTNSSDSDTAELYLNSVFFDTQAGSGAANIDTLNWLGRDGAGSSFFVGRAALIRVYSYVPSAGKVSSRYQATRHWFGV